MYPGTFARSHPDKPAAILAGSGTVLTYAQLDDRSARLARLLYERGLRRGDTVAMLSDNQLTAFEIYWAAMRSGLYFTPVNHHLARDEARYIVENSGAKALIAASSKADTARALATSTPEATVRLAFGGDLDGFERYESTLETVSAEQLASQPRGADLQYSSGTTGRPKGIRTPLPERQVDEPGDTMLSVFQPYAHLDADSIYLSPAPIYHTAPVRWCGMVHATGGTVIMMERFDAAQALAAIERYRVTHLQMVPTMFVRMLKLDPAERDSRDLSSLQVAVHAAAPCPPDVKRAMIDWWGPILLEFYAATEGNGVTLITSSEWLRKPGSVGRPVAGTPHICGDSGLELPAGQAGLIYFQRDDVTFEYLGDPEKTAEARHPDHPAWSTVGDVGYLDEDGYLFLTDRKSFTIISGGVNIYPQEIENALTLHPAVFDVAVIGITDAEMGQRVKAFVQAAPGTEPGPLLAEQLAEFLEGRIARFKIPREFEFIDELPRTPAGKLAKQRLLTASQ